MPIIKAEVRPPPRLLLPDHPCHQLWSGADHHKYPGLRKNQYEDKLFLAFKKAPENRSSFICPLFSSIFSPIATHRTESQGKKSSSATNYPFCFRAALRAGQVLETNGADYLSSIQPVPSRIQRYQRGKAGKAQRSHWGSRSKVQGISIITRVLVQVLVVRSLSGPYSLPLPHIYKCIASLPCKTSLAR